MKIEAKSPCRVDLAGGTVDIWPLYLYHDHAVTVNFAVNLYTSCVLETRSDGEIHLHARDVNREDRFASYKELQAARRYKAPLLAWAVRHFAPETGISLTTHSKAPAGAGISGSSSLLITVCSALNRLTRRGYSIEKIHHYSHRQ